MSAERSWRVRWLLLLAALGLPPLALAQGEASPKTITYESLMREEPAARREILARLMPEQKAEIVRTHQRRWLKAHQSRLSERQRKVIQENIATLGECQTRPISLECRNRVLRHSREAQKVFSKEEMVQIFTLGGDYVPESEG